MKPSLNNAQIDQYESFVVTERASGETCNLQKVLIYIWALAVPMIYRWAQPSPQTRECKTLTDVVIVIRALIIRLVRLATTAASSLMWFINDQDSRRKTVTMIRSFDCLFSYYSNQMDKAKT